MIMTMINRCNVNNNGTLYSHPGLFRTTFKIGEKVEAIWGADGQRYPGEILSILPNGKSLSFFLLPKVNC